MQTYNSVATMVEELRRIAHSQPGMDGQRAMCETILSSPQAQALCKLDPFSAAYQTAAADLHKEISGVSRYAVETNELMRDFDLARSIATPTPYCYGDSAAVGDFYLSWGAILNSLAMRSGQSVIEYGAGEGQLSIALARTGCDVTVVDVERRYLDSITNQCERLGIPIKTHRGLFGEVPDGRRYDRVVFFEAFHHAFEHQALARRLKQVAKDDGYVVFAGEPIVESSDFVPFAWGPRLDGLSVYSMHEFGWMELGFTEAYFVEMMMRAGWVVQARKHPMTFRGNCYIAKPLPRHINLGDDFLILKHGVDTGWDACEGTHRWTRGHAKFPMDESLTQQGATAKVFVSNYLPATRNVRLVSGGRQSSVVLEPGQQAEVSLQLEAGAVDLEIISEASRVCDLVTGSNDQRCLGVAVSSIDFSAPMH